MGDRWIALPVVGAVVVTAVAAVAHATPHTERLALSPNRSGVTATASFAGNTLAISARGLEAGTRVQAGIATLACARSYVDRAAGGGSAGRSGEARWTASDVLTPALRDGRDVLVLEVGARTIACASIPALRPAATDKRARHWGLWTFTRQFVD